MKANQVTRHAATIEERFMLDDFIKNEWEQLTFDKQEVKEILNLTKPKNSRYPYFVGTDLYSWLSNFEVLHGDFYDERKNDTFEIIYHDNTYNWNGAINRDIDFKILVDTDEKLYVVVKVHKGGDIRSNYTRSIMFSLLDYQIGDNDNGLMIFLEPVHESSSEVSSIEIDEQLFSIVSHVYSDEIIVYDHEKDEEYYGFNDALYSDNLPEFETMLKKALNNFLKTR